MELRAPAVVGPPAPELTEDVRDLFVTDSSDIAPFSHLFWPVLKRRDVKNRATKTVETCRIRKQRLLYSL